MASETTGAGRRYRAFITYSHADTRRAAWLHRRLEAYRLPRRLVGRPGPAGPLPRRLGPLFRDREELATATDLGERIEAALAASEALIVVCSPAAASSRWVDEEVRRFRTLGRKDRIFCLIVDGEPLSSEIPGRASEECFPPALRERLGPAAEQPPEPLAADVRPGGDGRGLALLKLIAGLLELNLDDLRRREQQRRARRSAALAGAALVVTAATSLLALDATIQRHAAERRQKQAEELVGFMLGNFTHKLRKLGRLDILESVDKQAMTYFESLPPGDVDESTLAERAKALREIGNTRSDEGDYAGAMEAFRDELAITSALARKRPNDPRQQNALGNNLLWLGVTYWSQNRLHAAETAMSQAVEVLEKAAALAPSDTGIRINLGYAYNNLGHLAEARGERDKAQRDYTQYMRTSLQLVATDLDNEDWQDNLGDAYDNLGKLAVKKGDFVEAVRNYQEEQLISANLLREHPSNQQLRNHLVRIDGILGRTLFLCGAWQAGTRYLREAMTLADQLVAYDSTQAGWRYNRAHYGEVLAKMQLEQGDVSDARKLVQTSLSDLKKLTSMDPANRDWRRGLETAQVTAALVAHFRHDDVRAGALAAAALNGLKKTPKTNEDTPAYPISATTATALLLLANIAQAGGDSDSASTLRTKAAAVIAPASGKFAIPRDLAAAVAVQLAAGDTVRARNTIDRLQRMGFRTPAFVSLLKQHGIPCPENLTVSRKVAQIIDAHVAASAVTKYRSGAASPSTAAQPGKGETP